MPFLILGVIKEDFHCSSDRRSYTVNFQLTSILLQILDSHKDGSVANFVSEVVWIVFIYSIFICLHNLEDGFIYSL